VIIALFVGNSTTSNLMGMLCVAPAESQVHDQYVGC